MSNLDYPDGINSLDFLGFNINQTQEDRLKMVTHQRNTLAQEIKDFLVKVGVIVPDCSPNGPELIHNLRLFGDHVYENT